MQKSNHPLSASAADTQPQPFLKERQIGAQSRSRRGNPSQLFHKEGNSRMFAAHYYDRCGGKSDPSIFFNQIDVPPSTLSGAVTVPLVMHTIEHQREICFWENTQRNP